MDRPALLENITKLRKRVRLSAEKCHFRESDILVLAVSKTRTAAEIRTAYELGLQHFGENYLQEALSKISELDDLPLTWHFIGPIQSNKTRQVAEHFHWVHSVDREKIARRLSEQRPGGLAPLNVCLQVNVSGEASKSGIGESELADLAAAVAPMPRLKLRGLMAIPAPMQSMAEQRRTYQRVRELRDALLPIAPAMDTLSMGMSDDLEAAIAEGATILRIGTAIFGPRGR